MELGISDDVIIEKCVEKYEITQENAREYVEKYEITQENAREYVEEYCV